jgi:hypothetical protein
MWQPVTISVEQVEEALRRALLQRLKPRGYRGFDESIGKRNSGWTSKFLRGERALTLETLLVVLAVLELHPARFFAEQFPLPASEEAIVAEALGGLSEMMLGEIRRVAAEAGAEAGARAVETALKGR